MHPPSNPWQPVAPVRRSRWWFGSSPTTCIAPSFRRQQKPNDTAKPRRLLAKSGATVTRRAAPVGW